MNQEKHIQNALQQFQLPAFHEIPDVGLYLEQVSRYMNRYLDDFSEMAVTPSMISNYAKQKMIDRVNKKTYTRSQIASLFFIVCCKTVLSMDHIKQLLSMIAINHCITEKDYMYFITTLSDTIQSLLSETTLPINPNATPKEKMIRNIIITIAHKMFLERFFTTPQKNSR